MLEQADILTRSGPPAYGKRVWAGFLIVGGCLLAASSALIWAFGDVPGPLYVIGILVLAVSLPGVAFTNPRVFGREEIASAVSLGVLTVGVVCFLVFAAGGLLFIGSQLGWGISDSVISLGRRFSQFAMGGGLVGLSINWVSLKELRMLRALILACGILGLVSGVLFTTLPILLSFMILFSFTLVLLGLSIRTGLVAAHDG